MRISHILIGVAMVAVFALSGCRSDDKTALAATDKPTVATLNVPSGTSLDVTLATRISSETAHVGDSWSGTIGNGTSVDGRNVIPAGSRASGTVSGVTAAHKGNRAMLDLQLNSISVGNHDYRVRGATEAVIAGSPRARNLGAIAASTVAGAIIGHAVGGDTKGTVIGGVIGGGVATGVVAKSSGYQVVLKEGTALTFTTNEAVAVRQ